MEFPIITNENFHTQSGNIYKLFDNGFWYQIECYLPSVETQYGCTSYQDIFEKLTSRLGTSKLYPVRKTHSKPYQMQGNTLAQL